jgi:ribosomal protein L12E/L44/L45/RPP1/RPP2
MATVAVSQLSPVEKEQLAISYASFVLSGSGAEVNQESLNAVLKAANITVSNGLVNAVSKCLKNKNVTEFFGSVGGGSAESAPQQSAPPAAKGGKK